MGELKMEDNKPTQNDANGSGRDANGKFVKGNKGGPGNPHAKKIAEYRSAMFRCVTIGDWEVIVMKARDDAIAGDKSAREWLTSYLLGKPTQTIEAVVETTQLTADEITARIDAVLGLAGSADENK